MDEFRPKKIILNNPCKNYHNYIIKLEQLGYISKNNPLVYQNQIGNEQMSICSEILVYDEKYDIKRNEKIDHRIFLPTFVFK